MEDVIEGAMESGVDDEIEGGVNPQNCTKIFRIALFNCKC